MTSAEDSKAGDNTFYKRAMTKDPEQDGGRPAGSSKAHWAVTLLTLLLGIAALVLAIIAFVDDDTGDGGTRTVTVSDDSNEDSDSSFMSREAAVNLGVRSFQVEAVNTRAKVQVLEEVIRSGDLAMSLEAYAASRASYEQIEVLAASFPQIDCDIDCRAYAYDHGDASPDFVGFHRIEALLFRDNDTAGALPFAEGLAANVDLLMTRLAEPEFFNEENTWAGMVGLATEIVAKKMSGEEEAYSRLSLLIFFHNYLGIKSQYMPFDAEVASMDAAVAQEVRESLEEAMAAVADYRDASGGNLGYGTWASYFELNNFDVKIIYDAALRVVQALTAAQEVLEIGSPEEDPEEPAAEVEVPPGFDTEVAEAVASLAALADGMETSVAALRDAIASGDLVAARTAYETSRFEYEQIEVLALAFEDIDSAIDARPYAFPLGEEDPGFKGFHKIERLIFRDNDLELALTFADGLVASTAELQAALTDTSAFDVVKIFEGLIGLSLEVGAKKISSEEESISDLSVLIFEMNFDGVDLVYQPFASRVSNASATDVAAARATCEGVIADIQAAGYPPAFPGSAYPSFKAVSLPHLADVVSCTYGYAEALVEAAHSISVFADENNPFHRDSFFPFRQLG